MKNWLIACAVLMAILIIGGAGYFGLQTAKPLDPSPVQTPITLTISQGTVQRTVTAPGHVVGTQEQALSLPVGGPIMALHAQAGLQVKQGDVLLQIDTKPLQTALTRAENVLAQAQRQHEKEVAISRLNLQIVESELAQAIQRFPTASVAQANLQAAQAALEALLTGPNANKLVIAQTALKQTELLLQEAQQAYDAVAWASDVGASPQARGLQAATLKHQEALATYQLASQGASRAEISQAQALVQQAVADVNSAEVAEILAAENINILQAKRLQAQHVLNDLELGLDPALFKAIEQAEQDLAESKLIAPFDGVILAVNAKVGESIPAGQALMLIANPQAVEVWTSVIEEDLPLIQIGQPVEIYFDAEPEDIIMGQVARIVPQRIVDKDRPLYPVYVRLAPQDKPEQVLSGMTADTAIIVAQKQDVLRLPRSVVRGGSSGKAKLKIWANNQIQEREVQVGLQGDVYVEIVAGLEQGDQVVGE